VRHHHLHRFHVSLLGGCIHAIAFTVRTLSNKVLSSPGCALVRNLKRLSPKALVATDIEITGMASPLPSRVDSTQTLIHAIAAARVDALHLNGLPKQDCVRCHTDFGSMSA
jgi:hypothetical protein